MTPRQLLRQVEPRDADWPWWPFQPACPAVAQSIGHQGAHQPPGFGQERCHPQRWAQPAPVHAATLVAEGSGDRCAQAPTRPDLGATTAHSLAAFRRCVRNRTRHHRPRSSRTSAAHEGPLAGAAGSTSQWSMAEGLPGSRPRWSAQSAPLIHPNHSAPLHLLCSMRHAMARRSPSIRVLPHPRVHGLAAPRCESRSPPGQGHARPAAPRMPLPACACRPHRAIARPERRSQEPGLLATASAVEFPARGDPPASSAVTTPRVRRRSSKSAATDGRSLANSDTIADRFRSSIFAR